jgi:hypothetical protein
VTEEGSQDIGGTYGDDRGAVSFVGTGVFGGRLVVGRVRKFSDESAEPDVFARRHDRRGTDYRRA